ncbi:MAG: PKD domain-containing protein, partial [Candidatus Bathyarchaeota archaeon]
MTYYIAEIRLNRNKNLEREEKMRKRLRLRLITLLLISLVLSTSIMVISVTASPKQRVQKRGRECEAIVASLRGISSEIAGLPAEAFKKPYACYRKVLGLKVGVAIWQVMVGAYKGTINNLRNDIRGKIEEWIVDPWKTVLIDKIDHIIKLIGGLCEDQEPPTIVSVLRIPETPDYDETATIMAQVIDEKSGVESVVLSCQLDSASWSNITMNLDDGLYVAEISPQPYNTTVSYMIYASDKADNLATSETISYIVGDFYPPIITYIEHVPTSPNYNETVAVFAKITESPEASGIKNVTLLYKTNSDWQPIGMTFETNLYTGFIPASPQGTVVHYKIRALDNAGNWVDSDVHSYLVADAYLPLARIDEPSHGNYLAGMVTIKVYVYDDNFDRAELKIEDTIVKQWTSTGLHIYDWNTSAPEYPDGVYIIQVTVYDRSENFDEETVAVILDNTSPMIDVPTWKPEEPLAYEEVSISVWINECGCASGIKNVTLWYRMDDEWAPIEMVMRNGLWTATIPGQGADVNVKFYIEAYDNVDNGAKTVTYNYTVKAHPNLPPVAEFSESAETVYTGETTTFNASESYDPDGTIVAYYWDFGDDTNASGTVVEHAYDDDGSYTVILTLIDDNGATATATATKHILNKPPVADFTESAGTVYTGEGITFDASSSHDSDGTIASYLWSFGDGTDATGKIVDHTYTEDGLHTVALTVTDDDGASSSTSAIKTVLNRPPAALFTEDATMVLTGEEIRFDASESEDPDGAIISYLWDFG